jgi:hypothetical protein
MRIALLEIIIRLPCFETRIMRAFTLAKDVQVVSSAKTLDSGASGMDERPTP